MSLLIEIESADLDVRQKRDGSGNYAMQTGYVHTHDRQGQPNRYPERFEFYAPRDPQGIQQALPPGKYVIAPESFQVDRGRLVLNYLSLNPAQAPKRT